MLDIYFESDKEVIHFCEHLFRYHKQIELKWKTNDDWGNHLYFDEKIVNQETIQAIAKAMVDVFIAFRMSNEIKKMVMEKYYYTNTDEIEEILEHTFWVLRDNTSYLKNRTRPTELLLSLFIENLTNATVVHFDSIVKFRLNVFKEQLLDYVGLAIDEVKQEKEHQSFVEMLRTFVSKKKPIFKEVHVVQGMNFSFFRSNGKQFSTMELRHLMYQEPLYLVGLDANEMNLSPLIAIAPQKIYIYGDHPSEPKTLTVINVFQEKVYFKSLSHFPFPQSLSK